MRAKALRVRRLTARRNREPLIPDDVLEKLAALRIPEANQFIYQACLEKLLRNPSSSADEHDGHSSSSRRRELSAAAGLLFASK
jgi:hypothetical protein